MMFSTSYIIAASQLFAIAFGAPLLNSNAKEARSLVERSAYKVFGGDGTVAQGWPDQKDWKSFEDLWTANEPTMKSSCSQFNMDNNSDDEIADIKKAITSVADQSKLPAEFLLAIMMQESKGCVRAPTTNYGYNNPGLMQSFQGAHTCNPSGSGTVPCPSDTITGMISDGAGIGLEAGLTQSITQSKADDASKYYKGARIYNSGSVDSSGNLGAGIATHCYATDVANRLIGWADGNTGCTEGSIGSVQGSSGGAGNGDGNGQTTDPPKSNDPPAAGGNSPSGPKADGADPNCTKWYDVKAGDTCSSAGISVDQLVKLNTSLKSDCSNLFAGTSYCVAA